MYKIYIYVPNNYFLFLQYTYLYLLSIVTNYNKVWMSSLSSDSDMNNNIEASDRHIPIFRI